MYMLHTSQITEHRAHIFTVYHISTQILYDKICIYTLKYYISVYKYINIIQTDPLFKDMNIVHIFTRKKILFPNITTNDLPL